MIYYFKVESFRRNTNKIHTEIDLSLERMLFRPKDQILIETMELIQIISATKKRSIFNASDKQATTDSYRKQGCRYPYVFV